jgi:hypothetical protein
MELPVTVYRWDDAGAPQIANGKPSEIIDILKKCLVTGYGAKAALGWTIPFEDAATFKVAFRSSQSNSSGGFVQFWSTTGQDNNETVMAFNAAKSMGGLDSYFDRQLRMMFRYVRAVKYWVLVGTAAGFYFMPSITTASPSQGTQEASAFFVGDLDSFLVNDPGRFVGIMYATSNDMNSASWSYCWSYSINAGTPMCRIYDTDGTSNFLIYKMDPRFIQGQPNNSGIPNVDRIFYESILVSPTNPVSNDRTGVNSGESIVAPPFRAKLPGFINTPQGGYSDKPWPVIENIIGANHILMPGYSFGRSWINTESWYA